MTQFTRFFEQNTHATKRQRDEILSVLASGPATISSLATKTEIPEGLVVWNIMGLMKWGEVEVAGEKSHQLLYGIREV